jgi:hypothetical protein
VHDVLAELVVATGDEDLVAGEAVGAVGLGTAVVVMSARLEPACGSVRAMVPKKRPVSRWVRYFAFCAGAAEAMDDVGVGEGEAQG